MRHWHTVRFPIDTGSGRPLLGMFAIDVSAVHQAVEAKESAQRQLLQSYKLAALGEMAGGIAHEVNNPVSIILGKSRQLQEILSTEPVNVAEAREFAEVITATSRRVTAIVNGLKSASRQADRDPCRMTPATQIIEATVSIVSARFRDAGVQLIVGDVAPDACFECRASEMIQVLTNLLSNALDAVAPLVEPWVRVDAHATAADLVMAVEDSGNGIPADLRTRIMLPFFTTKEVGKGTGLGLSISRGLVAGHGGALTLDENAEHTRFVVTVPLRQPEKAAG
jgi:C4-dicarboxylate-specific signal transduction histidine kinase